MTWSMRGARYVHFLGKKRNVYKVLVRQSAETYTLEDKDRQRWENNIKTSLKEIE